MRRSILGIFLWIALAFILLVATLSYGMVRAQALSVEFQHYNVALLAAERVRRGEMAVEIPSLQGKEALEMALLEGDRTKVERALARYEQAALQGLLLVERQRARLFHLQVAVALVLMAAALAGLVGLLYWTYGTFLRPIEALGRLAAEVRQGNLQGRAPAFPQPEFDQLGKAMNQMLDSLQARLAELTRSQKDWEELVSAVPQALVVVDAGGKVLSANPAAHRLLGAESLQGRPAAELFPLDEGLQERRATLSSSTGESLPILLRPVPLDSRPGVLWCLQDLRPEEKMEKLRQEALSTVLRELRAPVVGLAEMAEASGRAELAAQARQVLEMVDNLTLADQMRRGRWQCRRELLQLDELVAQVVRAHEAPAREREVLLEWQVQPAPVLGDRARLRLALHHLLGRLLEASPAGGKVSLSCWTARGRVLVEMVPDEPEAVAALRRWLSRPAVEEGLDLEGAQVVRQILLAHEAVVEPGPPDRLRLVLPQGQPEPETAREMEVEEVPARASGPAVRVAVIEEDSRLAEWLRRSLARAFEVVSVGPTLPPGEAVDVVLVDLDHAGRAERSSLPAEVPVLALARHPEKVLDRFLRLKASGLVERSASAAFLRRSLLRVARGEKVLSPEAAEALLERAGQARRGGAPAEFLSLTGREKEIFYAILRGQNNREIAEALFISEGTVKTHVNNMLRKLNLRDRVQLLLYAARHDLLTAVEGDQAC